METAFGTIIEFLLNQSVHLAILFAGIAALAWLFHKKSAHLRYLLWLIILTKCLMPPLLTVPIAVLPENPAIAEQALLPQTEAPEEMTLSYPPAAIPQTVSQSAEAKPAELLKQTTAGPTIAERAAHLLTVNKVGMVWMNGSFLYLSWILIRAVRFQNRLKQQRINPEESLEIEMADLADRFWPGLKVRAYLLEGIGQPFVWGLWRGVIYLPANFTRTAAGRKRHAILLHEIAHMARADALVNLIQVLAQGIYWFHPLVWIANRIIRAEREKCCDETAIAKLKTTPKEYGGAIVDVLTAEYQSRLAIPSLAVAGPAKNIEDRLKTIMNPKRRFYTRPTFFGLCMVLFLASIIVPTAIALTHKKLKPENLTPPFEVSGTVTDAQTGRPIEGTIVFDDGYGPTPRQETTTDPNGTFRYKTWKEEHNITAQAEGYDSQTLTLKTFPFSNSDKLHFRLTPQTADASGPMRISFTRGVPLTDALQMLSKYYKQTIIPSQAVIDARDKVPVTDLYDVTSLEMALEAILGTNRYIKDGNFIRVVTAEEYKALPHSEESGETIPVKVSARLLLLPDDPEKIESVFENAGIGFPKVFTSVVEGPADSEQIRTQFQAQVGDLDSASLSTFLAARQVETLIKAVQKEPQAETLSAPRVMVHSGEQAEISIGQEIPAGDPAAGKPLFSGVRVQVVPTVHTATGNIRLQGQTLVSNRIGYDRQKELPIMEVAVISTELMMSDGSSALLFGPVIKQGTFAGGKNTPDNSKRLLLLITSETAKGESVPGMPMENLPGFGAVGNGGLTSPDKENAVHDDLTGWYQMQNQTLIPVFKRDGAYYSASRGFEIPLRACPEGLVEAFRPSGEEGTTIGRFSEDPNKYFIRLVDRQREQFEQTFISGQKQEMTKVGKPFDLLDSAAPAPQSIDDFLGCYQPVWFPWVRFEIRKENQSYCAAEYYTQKPGEWTSGQTEKLSPLADRLGFAEDGEPVSWIYNDALKRFEITMKTDDTLIRMPMVRISPEEKAIAEPVNIGIPYWH